MLLESFKIGAGFPLIVFDLDGTILNSLPATFNALRAVISPRIGREVQIKDMVHLINNTDLEILREMAGVDDYQACLAEYLDHFRNHQDDLQPFPGVIELVEELGRNDVPVAILTGRARLSTDLLLELHGLKDLVKLVVAADDGPARKPAPDGIFKIAKELEVEFKGGLIIGDGPADVKAGRAASLFTIATRWCGLIPMEQITRVEPDYTVETITELSALLSMG
ncbi:MAG: HAD-IA family hydrolase [Deltaproteobacteria bacterium]|nr:HAD-IA family hydrolase [Deltaproteobacteria bacterium]